MSCSCRAVPWRTFVRGLAQVHKLDASSIHPLRPAGARAVVQAGGHWTGLRLGRGLHASQYQRQDAVAAAAETREDDESTTRVVTGSTAAPSGEDAGEKKDAGVDKTDTPTTAETKRARKSKKFKATDEHNTGESSTNTGDAAVRESSSRAKSKKKHKDKPQETDAFWTEPASSAKEGAAAAAAAANAKRRQQQKPQWLLQKEALKEKFPEGWKPRKRLSPDALAGIRALNAQFPDVYTTEALADKFEVSAEAIRRILRSKWRASAEEEEDRDGRWFRRGMQVWERKAALGIKPPQRWRREGIARDPGYHEWSKRAAQREREWEEEEIRKYREHRERIKRQRAAGTAP